MVQHLVIVIYILVIIVIEKIVVGLVLHLVCNMSVILNTNHHYM